MNRKRLAWLLLAVLPAIPIFAGWPGSPAPPRTPARAAAAPDAVEVDVKDDSFADAVIRVAPGATVVWTQSGRSPHNVTADDGSWASPALQRGSSFARRFDAPGRFPYYCTFHGAPGGRGMSGVILVGDEAADEPPPPPPARSGPPRTLAVPGGYPSIQAAVDAAAPGDLVLVGPGVYREAVVVITDGITIRGLDRNQVILDGEFRRDNGIKVLGAAGVAIENMTARHYTLNGFYWTGVRGYRGSYLTAHNNGDYGLYAFDSVYGQFDHSYASGHPDSGFYIGQCRPCHAVITEVVAEGNALGYSGTNAGGNLTVMNSIWRNNMSGIVPNTLDSELLAPQDGLRIVHNLVVSNHNAAAPAKQLAYPSFGNGIIVAGGLNNVIEGNVVADHPNYGILVVPNIDQNVWISGGNRVRHNRVTGSGRADLALGAPAGPGNCFGPNTAATSQPPLISRLYGCGSPLSRLGGGDVAATLPLLAYFIQARDGRYPAGDWQTYPAPPPQPGMPDPAAPPTPAWPTPESQLVPGEVAGASRAPGQAAGAPQALDEVVGASRAPGQAAGAPRAPGGAAGAAPQVLGVAAVAPWFSAILGLYAYLMPLVLYACWVAVAAWDLVRRDDLRPGARLGWLAAMLLVPGLGPVAYYALARSPIPAAMRWALVAGGLAAYLLVAGLAVAIAA